jgi:uncharacterized protein YjiS (DUF1127 family)
MLDTLRNRFATWRLYRQTVFELSHLDGHMLADMGLESPSPRAIKARARRASREICS